VSDPWGHLLCRLVEIEEQRPDEWRAVQVEEIERVMPEIFSMSAPAARATLREQAVQLRARAGTDLRGAGLRAAATAMERAAAASEAN
jgi:hypothetical protein